MGAAFRNAIFCEDDNFVSIFDGGQTVGDGNGCPVFGELFQTVMNPAFAFIIQCTGGFVQNQNRRILQKNSGNGDALFLAAGKSGTVLTDKCIIL